MREKVLVFSSLLVLFCAAVSLWALDINTATEKELAGLPGIGPVLARRIVEYRRRHGPFRSPEDLLAIKGIGPHRLERLRPYLNFGPGGGEGPSSAPVSEGSIYRWVDEKGVVHFTQFPEEIPRRYRSRAKRIPFPAGKALGEASPSENSSGGLGQRLTPGPAKPATDILGRDIEWYRREKTRLKNEIARLKKQTRENREVMHLLLRNSPRARRGIRTEYGLRIGEGRFLQRWAEYRRLRRINQELEKKLAELEYRLEKGLYREALRTHAPEEVLRFLSNDP
ncbi:helix-hairpin-helix domain-containing protein [Thermosulfurimonas sp. F29]|uniref:helix-hairpin-helix domain-containing protein n=1 Tax=Thermosulfurimonas sp. F29 TaxID=2867247 RepID=UPI001C840779|nr:helix-hairpin-helix domain-containing protein [Thermosulfurimonas sp. F29]MBX6423875.1 helix-hairpin-helix domain-containing protein [Thermosulfurimonas sp. F29]